MTAPTTPNVNHEPNCNFNRHGGACTCDWLAKTTRPLRKCHECGSVLGHCAPSCDAPRANAGVPREPTGSVSCGDCGYASRMAHYPGCSQIDAAPAPPAMAEDADGLQRWGNADTDELGRKSGWFQREDGYWTPWHLAAAALVAAREENARLRDALAVTEYARDVARQERDKRPIGTLAARQSNNGAESAEARLAAQASGTELVHSSYVTETTTQILELKARLAAAEAMVNALPGLTAMLREAYAAWDADRDSKVGKMLRAAAGNLAGYDQRSDEMYAAWTAFARQPNDSAGDTQ